MAISIWANANRPPLDRAGACCYPKIVFAPPPVGGAAAA